MDKKEYTGNLFYQLSKRTIYKKPLHLKGDSWPASTETYEIPMAAIREALVNALVHRDYSNFGRDIKVGIYDDALNIVSPGGLPHGITLNEALQGRSEIAIKYSRACLRL